MFKERFFIYQESPESPQPKMEVSKETLIDLLEGQVRHLIEEKENLEEKLKQDPLISKELPELLETTGDREILEFFAKSKNPDWRCAVARNGSTVYVVDILVKLADDKESSVRKTVAENHLTPMRVLIKLAEDTDESIRISLASKRRFLDVLKILAKDKSMVVRKAAAGNEDAPTEILIKLADDKESAVREAVAANKDTPVEILIKLADDKKSAVREAVLHNPSYADEILKRGGKIK